MVGNIAELDINQPRQNLPSCTHQPTPFFAQKAEISAAERLSETNQKFHRVEVGKD
jgi:hypothetical protein